MQMQSKILANEVNGWHFRFSHAGRHQRKSGNAWLTKNRSVGGTTKMPNKGTERQRPKSEPSTELESPSTWQPGEDELVGHTEAKAICIIVSGWFWPRRWGIFVDVGNLKRNQKSKEATEVKGGTENEDDSVRANCVRKMISTSLIRWSWYRGIGLVG